MTKLVDTRLYVVVPKDPDADIEINVSTDVYERQDEAREEANGGGPKARPIGDNDERVVVFAPQNDHIHRRAPRRAQPEVLVTKDRATAQELRKVLGDMLDRRGSVGSYVQSAADVDLVAQVALWLLEGQLELDETIVDLQESRTYHDGLLDGIDQRLSALTEHTDEQREELERRIEKVSDDLEHDIADVKRDIDHLERGK